MNNGNANMAASIVDMISVDYAPGGLNRAVAIADRHIPLIHDVCGANPHQVDRVIALNFRREPSQRIRRSIDSGRSGRDMSPTR